MTCTRLWQAEAIEDGRLDVPSMASFDRHVGGCAACARAREELAVLREIGLRLEPRRLSPFEHRRKRAELLRQANGQAVGQRRRRVELPLVAAVVVVALAFVAFRAEHGGRARPEAAAPVAAPARPAFELRPMGKVVFHEASSVASTRIVLSEGTLSLHVEHLSPSQRFVVELPDGELEVRGTRFIVEATGGHTSRVLVTEGVVALRLAGSPERLLAAGDSFMPGMPVPVEERGAPASARATLPDAVGPRMRSGSRSHAPRAARLPDARAGEEEKTNTSSVPERGSTPSPAEEAGEAFHTAMAAFSLGSYAEADERFAEFMERFPGDSHCEDVAFVRTVIALRRGDPGGAVARGRSYLRRFPDGLRRPEIERMIEEAGRAGIEPRGARQHSVRPLGGPSDPSPAR